MGSRGNRPKMRKKARARICFAVRNALTLTPGLSARVKYINKKDESGFRAVETTKLGFEWSSNKEQADHCSGRAEANGNRATEGKKRGAERSRVSTLNLNQQPPPG